MKQAVLKTKNIIIFGVKTKTNKTLKYSTFNNSWLTLN